MDVSRETPDVTTEPKCYDLTNIFVRVDEPTWLGDLLVAGGPRLIRDPDARSLSRTSRFGLPVAGPNEGVLSDWRGPRELRTFKGRY